MTAPETITLEQQIAAAKREVGQRRRVYPRLVSNQKMRQSEAEYEINAMLAIQATLQCLKDKRDAQTAPRMDL